MIDFKVSFIPNNVKDGEADLQMRVRWAGNILVMNVGHRIEVAKWDKSLQRCRANTTHGKRKVSASEINRSVRRYADAVTDCSTEFARGVVPTREDLRASLEVRLGKARKCDVTLARAAYVDFIAREGRLRGWTPKTKVNHITSMKTLAEFRPSLAIGDIDEKCLEDYLLWLQDKGLANRSTADRVYRLKTFLRWADKKGGYSVNPCYADFSPRVKVSAKTVVWLTMDELARLEALEFADPCLDLARDMFVFSCFSGLRYSDVATLRVSNIGNGRINVGIRKTLASVSIELNGHTRRIVEKRTANLAPADLVFGGVSMNRPTNVRVRAVCKMAGIDAPTSISYYKGAERVEVTKPKHELVTFHTGRRSFICNALSLGVAPQVVMKWTGHKGWEEMRPYIDIAEKSKADAMKVFG